MEARFYFRISRDKTGERLGVERQEPESLELCERLGMTPGERYIDNDLSATSGVERPDFERLLADLKADPGPVIVWHLDRLLRLSKDLERVIATGVNVYAVHAGYFDLSTPAGRATARTITAWSTYEGEQKSIRQKAANIQRAEMGRPSWPVRPFGLEMDGSLRKPEAKALAKCYADLLTGTPLAVLARRLNDKGFRTNQGNEWNAMTLRQLMKAPRNAGIREYLGNEVGKGNWTPIVSEETYRAVCYLLDSGSRKSGGGGRRKNLLSGLLRCSVCEKTLRVGKRGNKGERYPVYICKDGYHVSVRVEWADRFVTRLVHTLLSSPAGAALWETDDVDTEALQVEMGELSARLEMFAEMLGAGELTREGYRKATERAKERLAEVEAALRKAAASRGLHGAVSAEEAVSLWASFDTMKQRSFIESIVEDIRLRPRSRKERGLKPGDITVEWRQSAYISSK